MTAAQRKAQELLQSTPAAELLRKAHQLTHAVHASASIAVAQGFRAQRDLIDAELLRREAEAVDLLRQGRYRGADPGLSRSWGQRRRRLLDTLLAGR